MRAGDVALAVLTAILWGLAFVATRVGLDSFTPAQLAALRFVIAAAPVLLLPRPAVPWPTLIATGLTLFAALFLRERPTARQSAGMTVACAGLLLIVATAGDDLRLAGFLLTLVSAVSWGIGNIFLKRLGATAQLDLMVWLSLVVPLPALAVSLVVDGPGALTASLRTATWDGWAAALYLGVVGTVIAYTLWGRLLRRYPVGLVAPFSLLVPFVGAASSAIAFGERFGGLRLAGMACVLAGLAVTVLPVHRWRAPRALVRPLMIAVAMLACAAPAHAMTGAEWRRQPEPVKRAYVDGVVDAWQGVVGVQESVGTRDRGIAVFAGIIDCVRERLLLPPQIFAVVERHVEDNPGLLGKDMADLMFSALAQACRR